MKSIGYMGWLTGIEPDMGHFLIRSDSEQSVTNQQLARLKESQGISQKQPTAENTAELGGVK